MIEVEYGIKREPSRLGRPSVYPWEKLEVGGSFLAEGKRLISMSVLAGRRSKWDGRKYSCQTANNGIRVWRDA